VRGRAAPGHEDVVVLAEGVEILLSRPSGRRRPLPRNRGTGPPQRTPSATGFPLFGVPTADLRGTARGGAVGQPGNSVRGGAVSEPRARGFLGKVKALLPQRRRRPPPSSPC